MTKHSEWFEGWFNSPYYQFLYKNRDEQEASRFLENILDILKPQPNAVMLDMPCGRGRHSRYLAAKGYEVLGADLSEESILEAKKFENDHLAFVVQDMRRLFYINYFDFAFNLFTSIGYFATERENAEAIHTFSSALKPRGKLVLDFFNTHKVMNEFKPHEEKHEVEGVHFSVEKEMEGKIIVKKIEVKDDDKIFHFEERVQALTLTDFEKYFSANHLKTIQSFGNYKLENYDADKSERLILIAEKI